MHRIGSGLAVALLLSSAAGCVAPLTCFDDEMLIDGRCVRNDAGAIDGGVDAPPDTRPPCGGACSGATPFCVEDVCVECESAADCAEPATPMCVAGACVECESATDCADPLAPSCNAGTCGSCTEASPACSGATLAREVEAMLCAAAAGAPRVRTRGEVEAIARLEEDAGAALVCARFRSTPLGALLDGIDDGRIVPDLAALAECLAPLADVGGAVATLGATFCLFENGTGTVALGEPCLVPTECASGWCNVTAGCMGTCAPQVAIGSPCSDDAQCLAGGDCNGTVCVVAPPPPVPNPGVTCTADYQCLEGLVCTGGRCGEPPAAGVVCDDSSLFPCATGAYCDGSTATATCRARVAEGGACTDVVACAAGLRCTGSPGVCRRVVLRGARCDESVSPPVTCAAGTECVDGSCIALPDVGELCPGGTCYRGTCTGGTCTSLSVGTSCQEGFRLYDALDPCGAGSTCLRAGSSARCEGTATAGETCSGSGDCDEPALYCGEGDRCIARCSL